MFRRTHALAAVFVLSSTVTLAQSSAEPEHTAHTVTGTVSYRQRIALPSDAIVKVRIEDVSLADAPAKSVAEEKISTEGRQVPITFAIKYDPAVINPAHRYQIRATITSGDRLLFTTTTAYPVLTHGAPSQLDLLVHQVSSEPPDAKPGKPLAGTHWSLTELNGQAVTPQSGRSEIYIELNAETKRLSGSGGCNRLMGSYVLDGDSLRFKQVASTMMACLGDATMTQEQSFVKALSGTTGYRIHGSTLLLRGEDETVLARFDAQTTPKE
jgi:putative lipoprotein